jgi:hypothetical protein
MGFENTLARTPWPVSLRSLLNKSAINHGSMA